jgi:signal transduction histidine kinase
LRPLYLLQPVHLPLPLLEPQQLLLLHLLLPLLRLRLQPGSAELELEDTGPGIPAAVADRLFTPFATHGKAGGTGLGLSICRRIAEDHGGSIAVAPGETGRGARFVLLLPITLAGG